MGRLAFVPQITNEVASPEANQSWVAVSSQPTEMDMNRSNTELNVRELTIDETDAVSGGFLPLAIMAFAIGFDAGFIGVMAFGDLD